MHGLWEHIPRCGLGFFCLFVCFGVVLFKMFILSFESRKIYSFFFFLNHVKYIPL